MRKDTVFRGCTRPAMFMGVPYVPFFIGAGGVLLLAMYVNLLLVVLMPVVVFAMRQAARRDDMVFRLMGLRWQLRPRMRNLALRDGDWVLSPNPPRRAGGAGST